MNSKPLTGVVVTADQRDSRRSADGVPEALRTLAAIDGFDLAWERTAGDEIQAMTTHPRAATSAVISLVKNGYWRIGIGIGSIDLPLPNSTRAARGTAYLHARDAVIRARRSPVALAVEGAAEPDLEDALWLLLTVLDRRTPEGWQVADMLDEGTSQAVIAARLRVSRSAVSQRASRAGTEQVRRGIDLVNRLLVLELEKVSAVAARLIA